MKKDILIIGSKRLYDSQPVNKWKAQARKAKRRGIDFKLTFAQWSDIWHASGHWEERGPFGYHMCRKGDEGPYGVGNVYIAHHTQNKKDQWVNGHTSPSPVGAKKGKKYPDRPENPNYTRGSKYTEEEIHQRQLAASRKWKQKRREEQVYA